MKRIKIEDLPKDMKISQEEMKKVRGGFGFRSIDRTAIIGDYGMPRGGSYLDKRLRVPSLRSWLNQGDITLG